MPRAAAFLDRDGTIIEDANYIGSPDRVRLLPDAAATIRRLNDARIPVVIVTNQSGIARGYFAEADYHRVAQRIDELLGHTDGASAGGRIDATYFCPHHPDVTGACECRKPGLDLFRRAATDLDLDLTASLYVGDRWRDVAPALAFGGRGILVPAPATSPAEIDEARTRAAVAPSLGAAVEQWLSARAGSTGSVASAPSP